jgi:poly(A) polymerase
MEATAYQIVETLQKAGHKAYWAGGCVRDMLMEKEPVDYDIATSAHPDEIEDLLEKTIPIGKKFGVILAVQNEHRFEVATFRSDSGYSDGRRPDAVEFTSAKEDAVRRDFTINGLFYDPITKEVLDFVEGQKDIKAGIIRFIGEPHERIKEDHLRLLRAVRFRNQFGFKYAPETKEAVKDLAELIEDISMERVGEELTKMILHPRRAHSMRELDKLGILPRIFPEIEDCKGINQPIQYHREGDVFTHLMKALHDMPEKWVNKELAWAVFLHDIGKAHTFVKKPDRIHFDGHAELSAKLANKICRRLKFSKAITSKITWLIEHHMTVGFIPDMKRAHQIALFWHPWFEDLMRLHYCDEHGSLPIDLSLYDKIMKLYAEFKEMKLLEDHFQPLLTGDDLIKDFGMKPGPKIKKVLEALKEAQIEGEVKTKEAASHFIQQTLNHH